MFENLIFTAENIFNTLKENTLNFGANALATVSDFDSFLPFLTHGGTAGLTLVGGLLLRQFMNSRQQYFTTKDNNLMGIISDKIIEIPFEYIDNVPCKYINQYIYLLKNAKIDWNELNLFVNKMKLELTVVNDDVLETRMEENENMR